jgi:hypothetical protein
MVDMVEMEKQETIDMQMSHYNFIPEPAENTILVVEPKANSAIH